MQILSRFAAYSLDIAFVTTFKRINCWNAEQYSTRDMHANMGVLHSILGLAISFTSCYPGPDTLHCTTLQG